MYGVSVCKTSKKNNKKNQLFFLLEMFSFYFGEKSSLMYVTFLFLNKFALQEAERTVEGSLK